MNADYSRPLSVASGTAADAAGLESRLERTTIAVTFDHHAHAPTVANLVTNLRRLPVTVYLQADSSDALMAADIESVIAAAAGIDPSKPVHAGSPPTTPTLHLHVGANQSRADIAAVPDGHGTRMRRRGHQFPSGLTAGTGLGSVFTAAVLTGEAFKDIIGVHPARHRVHNLFDFNPVTLGPDGPDLPFTTIENTALIGAGAIGTAIGRILRQSGIEGAMTVVDPETFDLPNVTTYSLGTRDDAAAALHKTKLIARELPNLDVFRVEGTAQDFINTIDNKEVPMPRIVLGAVDDIPARHQIAKVYAALTLDGSTGGAAGTTVSLKEAVPNGPCLRCYYPTAPEITGPSPEEQLSQMTGLRIELLADGNHILSTDDIDDLPLEAVQMLTEHLGKPICGLARTLGLTGHAEAYRPSAAFVSQQAAALVVGALIARSNDRINQLRDLEYDTLFGPDAEMVDRRLSARGCGCQRDTRIIQQVMISRSARS